MIVLMIVEMFVTMIDQIDKIAKIARKVAEIVKTWEKLKCGLHGWVVRRRTKYQCETRALAGEITTLPEPSAMCTEKTEIGRGWVTILGRSSTIGGMRGAELAEGVKQ